MTARGATLLGAPRADAAGKPFDPTICLARTALRPGGGAVNREEWCSWAWTSRGRPVAASAGTNQSPHPGVILRRALRELEQFEHKIDSRLCRDR